MVPLDQKQLIALVKSYIVGREAPALMQHPLADALGKKDLTSVQLRRFCRLRYHAVLRFELLLERALALAKKENATALAEALHRNLCDERGVDYHTGRPLAQGAHSEWRQDFLDSLGVAMPDTRPFRLYMFTDADNLPFLIGILLAAEFTVPMEDARLLHSLRAAFPEIFTPADPFAATTETQRKATHYLQDHVEHDLANHLPELAQALLQDLRTEAAYTHLIAGIEHFCAERLQLYEAIQEKIRYTA